MSNDIIGTGAAELIRQGNFSAFIEKAKAIAVRGRKPEANIIFGLDATQSREATIEQARHATSAMFQDIRGLGDLSIKLAYYRGAGECRASGWQQDVEQVTDMMRRLQCVGGSTQIEKLLNVALIDEPGEKTRYDDFYRRSL